MVWLCNQYTRYTNKHWEQFAFEDTLFTMAIKMGQRVGCKRVGDYGIPNKIILLNHKCSIYNQQQEWKQVLV